MTYNENLRSAIVASLQNQELQLKKVKSQMNASMFTLYYAEGNMLTAEEKLDAAKDGLEARALVKKEAVNNSNISNNLLSSHTQASQHLKQSVSNAAVGAANIQAASASILRLASDLGSIFSIVNAADFESDIYRQAEEARNLINDTAYAAEEASQLAMEATMFTSEVSSATVLDKSRRTNTSMNGLLKMLSTDFDNASQVVAKENAERAAASASEKLAEGAFEDFGVDYLATNSAYNAIKQELNLGLQAVPLNGKEDTAFKVMFNLVKSPFEQKKTPRYPVKDYYIIIVKDVQKTVFSISKAENLVFGENEPDGSEQASVQYTHVTEFASDTGSPHHGRYDVTQTIDTDVDKSIRDSDGDKIEPGTSYVVFVMAVFEEDYKKKLNVFADFLSAASAPFILAKKLETAKNITVSPFNDRDNDYIISFEASQKDKVEYRAMLLPCGDDKLKGELTSGAFTALLKEKNTFEDIQSYYNKNILLQHSDANEQDRQKAWEKYEKEMTSAITDVADNSVKKSNISFFFNLQLAEQVSWSNYKTPEAPEGTRYTATFAYPITDVFGNLLVNGKEYLAVVLSTYKGDEESRLGYKSALSDFNESQKFTYDDKN